MSAAGQTHVCVLTPSGRGAVAVVAVEGVEATAAVERFFRAANRHPLSQQPIGRIVYGRWAGETGEDSAGEDLVVVRRAADSLEIHCHGGRKSSAQIVGDLQSAGCPVDSPELWAVRESSCPLASAAKLALADATTLRTARVLLDQLHGALRTEIEAMLRDLDSNDLESAAQRLNRLLGFAALGLHLTKPWQVVIAGRPNVGKSSLINTLAGYQRAIVFDQPGTTRDVVSAATAIDGWPVELSDTAGLQASSDAIEVAGISLASERLQQADWVVWVLDAKQLQAMQPADLWHLAQEQAEPIQLIRPRTTLVVNKIDLVAEHQTHWSEQAIRTSTLTGQGIDRLLAALSQGLVPQVPDSGEAVPFHSMLVEAFTVALAATRKGEAEIAATKLRSLL